MYGKAVRAFADAGCRYLQLDEVYIALLCDPEHRKMLKDRGDDPDRLLRTYAALTNAAVAGIPADMTITMHLCRGNFRSTFMGTGGYEPVAEMLFNTIKVHGYFMEYDTDRAGGFRAVALRAQGQDRGARPRHHQCRQAGGQGRDHVPYRGSREVRAARAIPCPSPQCGFASHRGEGQPCSLRRSNGRSCATS